MFTWKQITLGTVVNRYEQKHLLWPQPLILKNNQEGKREDEKEQFINDMLRAHAGRNTPGSIVLLLALNSETSHERCVSQKRVLPTPLRHDGRACRNVLDGCACRDVILENRLLIHRWDFCLG